jgi:xylulokinase
VTLVAGVDCSTQNTKVLVCDAETGEVLREGRSPHPDLTEVDPAVWWSALEQASSGLLDGVAAISVGGQQHGMVLVDEAGTPVRDALLWNDNRSARSAQQLIDELGGPQAWADRTGLVPVSSFTVSKLRWVAEHEPDAVGRASGVMLPHDWLTHRLRADGGDPTTDRGDASGTGYFSAADDSYRHDLLELAFGRSLAVPTVAAPADRVGETASGLVLAPGTGDNMAAALGLVLSEGDVVLSLGTSGTVFAVSEQPAHDASGVVAGFADATGRFLPLAATLNAARVITAALGLAGAELADLEDLVAGCADSDGLTLLPFLDGERTPPLPDARGLLQGLTRHNATQGHLVRAAIEGMLCGLASAVQPLHATGVTPRRLVLIGGAARSAAVQQIAAGLFDLPVLVPEPGEYVALGAARQAAWALIGAAEPPAWPVSGTSLAPDAARASYHRQVRDSYDALLAGAAPLLR